MRRYLAIASFLIVSGAATFAQAQVLRTTGNEVFCKNKSDFPQYLAVVNNKKFTVAGCTELKKGVRYKVLEEHPESGLDKIHLLKGARGIDGYVLGRGR